MIAQKFKLLHQLDNKLLHSAASYCKIACFLINAFGKRLNADVGIYEQIVDHMISKRNYDNTLVTEVETQKVKSIKITF